MVLTAPGGSSGIDLARARAEAVAAAATASSPSAAATSTHSAAVRARACVQLLHDRDAVTVLGGTGVWLRDGHRATMAAQQSAAPGRGSALVAAAAGSEVSDGSPRAGRRVCGTDLP